MNQYIEEMQNKFPELDFSKFVYKDKNSISTIICSLHGEFTSNYTNLVIFKCGCIKCKNIPRSTKSRMLFIKEVENRIKEKGFTNIILEPEKYLKIDRDAKIDFKCSIHGPFKCTLRTIGAYENNSCPSCRGVKTPEERVKDLENKFPNLDFSEFVYEAYSKKSKIICVKHGAFYGNYDNLISKKVKYGCPKCSREHASLIKTKYKNLELVKQKYPNLDFSKFEYKGKKIPSIIICPEHGEFQNDCDKLLNPQVYIACPKCRADMYVSRAEEEIREFIESIYNGKKEYNSRNVISPYELDFYLPEINLAFEYNGIYWHSDKVIKRTGKFNSAEEYHKFKNDECSKLGIDLFHIKEEDYKNDKEQIFEFIKNEINSRI